MRECAPFLDGQPQVQGRELLVLCTVWPVRRPHNCTAHTWPDKTQSVMPVCTMPHKAFSFQPAMMEAPVAAPALLWP